MRENTIPMLEDMMDDRTAEHMEMLDRDNRAFAEIAEVAASRDDEYDVDMDIDDLSGYEFQEGIEDEDGDEIVDFEDIEDDLFSRLTEEEIEEALHEGRVKLVRADGSTVCECVPLAVAAKDEAAGKINTLICFKCKNVSKHTEEVHSCPNCGIEEGFAILGYQGMADDFETVNQFIKDKLAGKNLTDEDKEIPVEMDLFDWPTPNGNPERTRLGMLAQAIATQKGWESEQNAY